jgi:hypothetical protein
VKRVHQRLAAVGVECHVWRRKELESYLLEAPTIGRVSGAPVAEVSNELISLADHQRRGVSARVQAERLQSETTARRHDVDVMEAHARDFEVLWADEANRPYRCNAKDMLHGLNEWLTRQGHRAVSARSLSYAMRKDEIPDEMIDVITRAEETLT